MGAVLGSRIASASLHASIVNCIGLASISIFRAMRSSSRYTVCFHGFPSTKHRRVKNDKRDAEVILNLVRGYVLAGMELPSIWVPGLHIRDDRERVRRRLDVGRRLGTTKTQIRWLLYRNGIEKPLSAGKAWSVSYQRWLAKLAADGLRPGTGAALASLLRQHDWLVEEKAQMQQQVEALSETEAYRPYVEALCFYKGVGILTAVWSRVASVPEEMEAYQRLVTRNPKRKKIAVVARMRHLGVLLWHEMKDVQDRLTKKPAVA